MGVSAAKQVFEQSPESVRTWIKDRQLAVLPAMLPGWSAFMARG